MLMPPHNEVKDNRIVQMQLSASDFAKLAEELAQLRQAMEQQPEAIKHHRDLTAVEDAEDAAKRNDGAAAQARLKAVGAWTLGVATSIGTGLAVAAIKQATGL